MNNFAKIIFGTLIISLTFLFIVNCANNTEYLQGNTQVSVTYYNGENNIIETNTCYANYECVLKNKEKCIQILYKEAHISIKKGVKIFNETRNSKDAAFQYSYALCNFLNIDKILVKLKSNDYKKWQELDKKGFIQHLKLSSIKLAILIDQYNRSGILKKEK